MSTGSDGTEGGNSQGSSTQGKNWVDGTLDRSGLPAEMQEAIKGQEKREGALLPKRLPRRSVKLRRDPVSEPKVSTMFKQRMAREGRAQELSERVREVIRETGMGYSSALEVVMPQMGYLNQQAEITLYRRHREECLRDSVEASIEAAAELEREESRLTAEEQAAQKAEEEFEAALATLPANATKARELEWIEAHPAMMRHSRMKATGKEGPVIITAADVLDAPHGVCPSRAAAVQLQHWANNSTKFFEQIMSEAKKKSSDGAGSAIEGEVEDDLSEVEGLLDF